MRLCSDRLSRLTYTEPRRAEAVVIHEVLHTLGLGERPPAPEHITERVLYRCRWPFTIFRFVLPQQLRDRPFPGVLARRGERRLPEALGA